jgi:hypothetical protein
MKEILGYVLSFSQMYPAKSGVVNPLAVIEKDVRLDTFSDTYDSLLVLIAQDPVAGSRLRTP